MSGVASGCLRHFSCPVPRHHNLGAIVLFILWVYYTAIVFLLGAVVAETWELKKMLQTQRAILG